MTMAPYLVQEDEEDDEIIYERTYILDLAILKATNIDLFSGSFPPANGKLNGYYRVVVTNEHGLKCQTAAILGKSEPMWNRLFSIRYHKFPIDEFLDIEVVEECCHNDPGTSHGSRVVGRVRIRISVDNIGQVEKKREELIKVVQGTKRFGGILHMEMKLSEVVHGVKRGNMRKYVRVN